MRIGCLQFAPLQDEVSHNLSRADAVLLRADPEDLDLLVLPELAFVGQGSNSLNDIYPFLEPSSSGVTSMWARTVALKYGCTVVAGYAEKVDARPKWPGRPEYYNSTIAVNSNGETVGHYRKCHLQPSEEAWALEGPNPFHGDWLPELGQVAIGTSMDINPYKFQDRWENLDFAFHIMEIQANLVIITMAWPTHEDPRRFSRAPLDPDTNTLMYWISRLEPIIRAEKEEEVIVVFCNKCGIEAQNCYVGTSTVLGISAGEVRVYGILGRGTKELLVVDTDITPFGRLVYCPSFDLEKEREAQMQAFLRPRLFSSAKPGHKRAYSADVQSLLDTMNIDYPVHLNSRSKTPTTGFQSSRMTNSSFPSKTLPSPLSFKAESLGSMGLAMIEPNILTPSAPSPTPQGVRPRFMIPPIESITQRYIVSQPTKSTKGYRHIPTPIPPDEGSPFSFPKVVSGKHDISFQGVAVHNRHQDTASMNGANDQTLPLSAMSDTTAFSDWFESEFNSYNSVDESARVISGTNISPRETDSPPNSEPFESRTRHAYTTQMIHGAPPSPAVRDTYMSHKTRRPSPICSTNKSRSRSGSAPEDYYTSHRHQTPVDTYADALLAHHLAKMTNKGITTSGGLEMKEVKSNSFASLIQRRPKSASASLIITHNEYDASTPNSGQRSRGRRLDRRNGKERGSSGRGQSGSNSRSVPQTRHRSASQPVDLAQFKLIEEFPSPNCPVHGIAAREKARRTSSLSRQRTHKESRSLSRSTKGRVGSLKFKSYHAPKRREHLNSVGAMSQGNSVESTARVSSKQGPLPMNITSMSNSDTPSLTAPVLERHQSPEVPWVETWMPPISKSVPPTSISHNSKDHSNSSIGKTLPPPDGRATPRAMVILFDEENTNWADEGGSRPLKCVERSVSVEQYHRKTQVV